MDFKLKWKVDPEPTGRYRSFSKRGWPTATFAGTDFPAAQITCEEEYSPSKVKSGDHKELTVYVSDYSSNDGKWKSKTLVKKFKTLQEVKDSVLLVFKNNPEFLPRELKMTPEEKEKERIIALSKEYNVQEKFETEVKRILKSGYFIAGEIPVYSILGVALGNITDELIGNFKSTKEYKNLTKI